MSISCNFLFPLYRLLSTDVDKLKIIRFQLSSLKRQQPGLGVDDTESKPYVVAVVGGVPVADVIVTHKHVNSALI